MTELVAAVGLAQPHISRHLRVLREVGLVDVRDDGRQRFYRVRAAPLREIADWLTPYEQLWAERFDHLDTVLADLREETQA